MNGKKLDVIFACVGGGGLLSGIAAYVKALRPSIKVGMIRLLLIYPLYTPINNKPDMM